MTKLIEDTEETVTPSFVELALAGNMVGMRDSIDSSLRSRIAAQFEPEDTEEDEDQED